VNINANAKIIGRVYSVSINAAAMQLQMFNEIAGAKMDGTAQIL
jgi:hypothetical protein